MNRKFKIGILALQGDFDAHRRRLQELGVEVILVRKPEELDGIDGLVIPGGESTTILKLLGEAGLRKLTAVVHAQPVFGTCAGAILLAKHVTNPAQRGLGALDATVRRNAYGRQIDSSIREGKFALDGSPLEMVFIRAPRFEHLGPRSKSLPKLAVSRSWCAKGTSWRRHFIRNCPRIPVCTVHFSPRCNKTLLQRQASRSNPNRCSQPTCHR